MRDRRPANPEAGQVEGHGPIVGCAVDLVDGPEQVVAALLVHDARVAAQRLQPVAGEGQLACLRGSAPT